MVSESGLAAPGDLWCWFWAAWPQRDGRLDIRRIAKDLGVSPSTVRRWLSQGARPTVELEGYLRRRAVLRGRGRILWPSLDEATVTRDRQALAYAERATVDLREADEVRLDWLLAEWHDRHCVQTLWWPRARIFTGHVSGPRAQDRSLPSLNPEEGWVNSREVRGALAGGAQLVKTTWHRNRHTATRRLLTDLRRRSDRRCIVPGYLVKTGRTRAFLPVAGTASVD